MATGGGVIIIIIIILLLLLPVNPLTGVEIQIVSRVECCFRRGGTRRRTHYAAQRLQYAVLSIPRKTAKTRGYSLDFYRKCQENDEFMRFSEEFKKRQQNLLIL